MQTDEKVNILVVDDLPEKLLVIETILEGLGQNLVTARSGREALRHLLDRDFAVILLDVYMPDMDGLETAAMIRNRRQTAHTPIIFITAFSDEMHTAQGYSLGAVDYIFSPVVPEILRAKVNVFVDLYKMTQRVRHQAEEHIALAREQAARAAAEETTRRSTFLAEASSALTKSLDYDATLHGLARVLVPFMGDFGAVTVAEDRLADWKTLVAWDDPLLGPPPEAPLGKSDLPPDLADQIREVLATGRPLFLPDGPARHPGPPAGDGDRIVDEIHGRSQSQMIVPLGGRGRVLGALTLINGPSGRRLRPDDLRLAEDLADRAAIAIDNARLYRDIQEGDHRKNEFLAMLAHELRNPLAPIRNAVQILQHLALKDKDLDWAADVIGRQVGQMVRLVDDLLDISRISGGKIQLRKEQVDIVHVVNHAVETSRPMIESRGQELIVEGPDEPIWVDADRARLAQILANLLNNAAKYTADGGKIRLSVAREGRDVVFRVRDTGIGIPPEMLATIFDLFTQVDRSLDRSQGGLGIGLTLVRRLIEKHGGSVQASSEGVGRGSEFTLRMPTIAAPVKAVGSASNASRVDPSNHRILIVDDNVDSAQSLARLLRRSGHQISLAHDGLEALQQFEAAAPEFILLDIGLPGMDGYEVARTIRERPDGGDVVLVALTGYGRDEDRQRSREVGFDHHLVKPIEFDRVITVLKPRPRPADKPLARTL